ncbi:MAG TPA: hypothetical protein VFA49_14205, partial [Chloroflexota bacterium]|nr:hypothetical protein [Chloroflexota bacterium]
CKPVIRFVTTAARMCKGCCGEVWFIEQRPEHAEHARHLVFVDDLEARVAQVAERGLTPVERETYANGVRKTAYRDPDRNEFGFGGAPVSYHEAPVARSSDGPPIARGEIR